MNAVEMIRSYNLFLTYDVYNLVRHLLPANCLLPPQPLPSPNTESPRDAFHTIFNQRALEVNFCERKINK